MKKTLLFVPILASLILTGCWDVGRGEKIGNIVKLAEQGMWGCLTWEAEIIRGGFSDGSGVNGTAFHFTIEDKSLLPAVKKAMEAQQEVKITYKSEAVTMCRSESGDHFLTSIEPLRPPSRMESVQTDMAPNSVAGNTKGQSLGVLDRQRVADQIFQSNKEILRQNQELVDLLKK